MLRAQRHLVLMHLANGQWWRGLALIRRGVSRAWVYTVLFGLVDEGYVETMEDPASNFGQSIFRVKP